MTAKETKTTVPHAEQGEALSKRLRVLIGKRSARAAAKDWGLSFSTLNNYLNRGTEPSFSVAVRIAEIEGVSIEWLAFGSELSSDCNSKTTQKQQKMNSTLDMNDAAKLAWLMIYESLDEEDSASLLRLIHREGVKKILNTVLIGTSGNQEFLNLSNADQQKAIRLAQQIKESMTENGLEKAFPHNIYKNTD